MINGRLTINSTCIHRIPNHDDFLQGKDDSLNQFFDKDVDAMNPQEIIMYKMYTELLHLKNFVQIKDPQEDIRLDPAMRKKLDAIHGMYHEAETKAANDALFKPYNIEIIPIETKHDKINNEDDVTTAQDSTKDHLFKFYTVYDYDGDGTLDRNDFHCEYRINNELVELTDIEIEESLEKMRNSTKNRIYEIFHNENYVDKSYGRIAAVWYWFIMLVVAVSIAGAVCSSVESFRTIRYVHKEGDTFFDVSWDVWEIIEMISTAILTFEYAITIFMVRNRCTYVLSFQNVIDFLAITPYYIWISIWFVTHEKWRTLNSVGNLLRTLRALRLFRTRALSNPYVLLMVGAVREFVLGTGMAVFIIVSMVCLFMGSLMFAAQSWDPDTTHGYDNIFMGMWFVIVTMSTVGYGDISPTTPVGLVCGLLTIVVGVTVFSMILMVTGQYYSDLLNDYNKEITDIKRVLLSLVDENVNEFRKMVRQESGETLYKKCGYALRCEKRKFLVI